MSEALSFWVAGHPEPGGSKTAFALPNRQWRKGMPMALAFLHGKDGRPIINVVDANDKKVKPWRKLVAAAAGDAMTAAGLPLFDGALLVQMDFFVHRNKGHFGTGRNARLLKESAPLYPAVAPDVLKLSRAAEDAMTGVVYTDDARTVDMLVRKRFCDGYVLDGMEGEGVLIKVMEHEMWSVGEQVAATQGSLLPA